jgi:hypothetical protein
LSIAKRERPHERSTAYGVWAIYRFEMARALRTLWQSVVTPVITTALYFVVFGSAIGGRMTEVDGVPYGAFIVPGLIMLSLFTQSIFNASFGIYFPKFTGTIYEILSAPVSSMEIVIAYVGAAATKSAVLGLIILATAALFVPLQILHPVAMFAIPGADLGDLQPVRLHHRRLGQRVRAAADDPDAGGDAPDLPRRVLLFDRHAAAGLADDHPVQPGGLSDLGLPLDLLRGRRRGVGLQRAGDARLPRGLPGRRRLDLQDGLSAEELMPVRMNIG